MKNNTSMGIALFVFSACAAILFLYTEMNVNILVIGYFFLFSTSILLFGKFGKKLPLQWPYKFIGMVIILSICSFILAFIVKDSDPALSDSVGHFGTYLTYLWSFLVLPVILYYKRRRTKSQR